MFFADLDLARRIEGVWGWLGVENARTLSRLYSQSGATTLAIGGGHAAFLGAGSHQTHVLVHTLRSAEPDALAEMSLEAEPEAAPQRSVSPEIRVTKVKPGEIGTWANFVLRCFFGGPEGPPAVLLEGAVAMVSIPAVSGWLVRGDDRVAGGGALVVHDGLALICGDGTLPPLGSRRLQTTLLRVRLAEAQKEGCDLAVICTQPGSDSQRNAEREGFRVVYARTTMVKE